MTPEEKNQAIEAIKDLKVLAKLTPIHEEIDDSQVFSVGIHAIALGQILTGLAGNKISNPHLKEFEPIIEKLKEMYSKSSSPSPFQQ